MTIAMIVEVLTDLRRSHERDRNDADLYGLRRAQEWHGGAAVAFEQAIVAVRKARDAWDREALLAGEEE